MDSLTRLTAILLAPKALPAPGASQLGLPLVMPSPAPALESPVRKRRSLKMVEPGPATAEDRRERATRLRAEYPSLVYDFEPSPSEPAVDPLTYDVVIVAFSGGKDSLALVLLLLLMGVPKDKIELWHHDVDGAEGSTLFDWPCTRDYCRKVAAALDVKLYFSWKIGGFERELTKTNARTAGNRFELPDGSIGESGGENGKVMTQNQFPMPIGDLGRRWCSSYLKIMVMEAAIRNQARFTGKRTLVLTGERAEESTKRATYNVFEEHRSNIQKRVVHVWRPILRWPEPEVWKLIERHKINPHPAYWLGWGRVSCAPCIFGSPDQWASLRIVNPRQFNAIAAYETKFGKTIEMPSTSHRSPLEELYERTGRLADLARLAAKPAPTVVEQAEMGNPFAGMTSRWIKAATSREYTEPVFLTPWELPNGAILGDGSGPT